MAKKYLLQIQKAKNVIEIKREQRLMLRSQSLSINKPLTHEPPAASKKNQDKTAEMIADYLELDEQILKDITKLILLQNKIASEINALDNIIFYNLLKKRYVECKRLELIAVEMGYSYEYIRRIHGHALIYFVEFYNKSQKVTSKCDNI